MARKASSASASRARRSSSSAASFGPEDLAVITRSSPSLRRLDIQPDQSPLAIRKVADETPQGRRQFPDQRGHGDDLLAFGQHRLLVDVNHPEVVATLQMLLANLLDVGDGAGGA